MFVTLGCFNFSCVLLTSRKPPPAHKYPAPFSAKTVRMNCCRICSFQGTGAGSFSKALVGLSRLELPTSRLSGVRSNRLSYKPVCCFQHSLPTAWRRRDSNSRPPACKAGALPTELRPHIRKPLLFKLLIKSPNNIYIINRTFALLFIPNKSWLPPILPYRLQYSTFGRIGLYRRVRDVYGCYSATHRNQLFQQFIDRWTVKQSILDSFP